MKHRKPRLGRLESHTASLNVLVDRLSTPVLLVERTGHVAILKSCRPRGPSPGRIPDAPRWLCSAAKCEAKTTVLEHAGNRTVIG